MKLIAPILTLAGFIWLASYSLSFDTAQPAGLASYTPEQVLAMNEMVGMAVQPATLKQRQAAALQSLYGVTDDEIAKPVVLWRD